MQGDQEGIKPENPFDVVIQQSLSTDSADRNQAHITRPATNPGVVPPVMAPHGQYNPASSVSSQGRYSPAPSVLSGQTLPPHPQQQQQQPSQQYQQYRQQQQQHQQQHYQQPQYNQQQYPQQQYQQQQVYQQQYHQQQYQQQQQQVFRQAPQQQPLQQQPQVQQYQQQQQQRQVVPQAYDNRAAGVVATSHFRPPNATDDVNRLLSITDSFDGDHTFLDDPFVDNGESDRQSGRNGPYQQPIGSGVGSNAGMTKAMMMAGQYVNTANDPQRRQHPLPQDLPSVDDVFKRRPSQIPPQQQVPLAPAQAIFGRPPAPAPMPPANHPVYQQRAPSSQQGHADPDRANTSGATIEVNYRASADAAARSRDNDDDGDDRRKRSNFLFRCLLLLICLLVAGAIIGVAVYFLLRDNGTDNTVSDRGDISSFTFAPTPMVPTLPPTTLSPTTTEPSTAPTTAAPTNAPTEAAPTPFTNSPSSAPSEAPTIIETISPTENEEFVSLGTNFAFAGDAGSRLGVDLGVTADANVLATLDGTGVVRVYQLDGSTTVIGGGSAIWMNMTAVPSLEEETTLLKRTSLAAASLNDGTPIVAMTTRSSLETLRYNSESDSWEGLGEQPELSWLQPDGVTVTSEVSSPSVVLSTDGTTMVSAFLHGGGQRIVAWIYRWDSATNEWSTVGDAIVREVDDAPILDVSLAVSGDGSAVAIGDWRTANPSAVVETFEISSDGSTWTQRQGSQELTWGASAVALSANGRVLAMSTPAPGRAMVFTWDFDEGWSQVGQDLVGGSSIALSSNGRRLVVGSPLFSTVEIYEFEATGDNWQSKQLIEREEGTQFGSTLGFAADGSRLIVGAPLDDFDGTNSGRVFVYETESR